MGLLRLNALREHRVERVVVHPKELDHDLAGTQHLAGGFDSYLRTFLKFGQLMLDDGTWKGRRILSDEFVRRASSTLMKIGGRDYGLLWWPQSFTVDDRTIRGFAALGNGGQIVMVFPELKLVVATNGGSYASRGWRFVGGDLITKYILPAVRTP